MAHTPGPWHRYGTSVSSVHNNARLTIARLPSGEGCVSLEERAGNAPLIQAAPDLLTTLKAIIEAYVPVTHEGYSDIGGTVTRARAAIAKAEPNP